MKLDLRPRRSNAPRPADKSAPQYLQWLRSKRCACGERNPACEGKMQAAHVPDPATKGMGTKSADKYAIPLSSSCHFLQHVIGWPEFTQRYLPGDPRDMAEAYWKAWPQRAAWEAKNG